MTCLIDMKLYKDNEICYDLNDIKAEVVKKDNYEIISFKDENIKNIIDVYNEGCILYRKNDEFEFKLDTIKNESTYLLKEIDSTFNIKIEKCEYKKEGNKIIIEYKLETDESVNKIELIKGGIL